jgi:hypothetical protein
MKPMPNGDAGRDDSAVSVLIGYIVNIGIAALVVSLTLLLLQGVFADAQGSAVESEMRAVGQSFAGELERVDVLSNQTDGNVTAFAELPESENPYSITVFYDGPDKGTRVNVESGSASVDIAIANETAIAGAADGITIPRGNEPEISYNTSGDEIVIE